jgi:uncharacterized membrane protein
MTAWKVRQLIVLAMGFLASVGVSSTFVGRHFAYQQQPLLQQVLLIFALPAATTVIYLAVISLQRRQQLLADALTADPAVQGIVFWILLFLIAVHLLVLTVLAGVEAVQPWASRAVVMLGGLTLVAVGNLLPRMRPNAALGIRTSRTLVDRRLWMLLHRAGGYLFVMVGFATLVTSTFLAGPTIAAIAGAALLTGAVMMSVYYHKLTHAADVSRGRQA